jgi:hypothetical protein
MPTVAAIVVELALLAAVVVLLGGWAGSSVPVAFGAGVALMAAFGVPSLKVLLWGRRRSNAEFLSSVVGLLLAKLVVVGAAVLFVWMVSDLPRLEFVWGLMAGWVASFVAEVLVLRSSRAGAAKIPGVAARSVTTRNERRRKTTTPRG